MTRKAHINSDGGVLLRRDGVQVGKNETYAAHPNETCARPPLQLRSSPRLQHHAAHLFRLLYAPHRVI